MYHCYPPFNIPQNLVSPSTYVRLEVEKEMFMFTITVDYLWRRREDGAGHFAVWDSWYSCSVPEATAREGRW